MNRMGEGEVTVTVTENKECDNRGKRRGYYSGETQQ